MSSEACWKLGVEKMVQVWRVAYFQNHAARLHKDGFLIQEELAVDEIHAAEIELSPTSALQS